VGMFEKVVVIDGKGHVLGRLAAIVAKELQNGQPIVIVRCEDVNISGSLFRNQLKFTEFLAKRTNTNPARGPIHARAPGRIVARTIRGMIQHKSARGQAAMDRLKTYEGVPHPYDKMKRQVVPDALRYIRLRPGRKFCNVGDLAAAFGWKQKDLIERLENKRKTKGIAYHATKKALAGAKRVAEQKAAGELAPILKQLAVFGYAPANLIEKKEEKVEKKSEKPTGKPAKSAAAPAEVKEEKPAPKKGGGGGGGDAPKKPKDAAEAPKEAKDAPKEEKGKKGGKAEGGDAPKKGGGKPKEEKPAPKEEGPGSASSPKQGKGGKGKKPAATDAE